MRLSVTVQYSTVQYSTVLHSATQYSTVHFSKYSTVQYTKVHCSLVQNVGARVPSWHQPPASQGLKSHYVPLFHASQVPHRAAQQSQPYH